METSPDAQNQRTDAIQVPDEIMPEEFVKSLGKDFSLFYNDKKYSCCKALTGLISLKLQKEMLSDPFLSDYHLPLFESSEDIRPLSAFLSGAHLIHDNNNQIFLYMISSILQISYLEEKLSDNLEKKLQKVQLDRLIKQANYLFLNGGNVQYHETVLASYFPQNESDSNSDSSDSDTQDNLELLKQLPVQFIDSIFMKQKENIDFDDPDVIKLIISMGGRLLKYLNLNKLGHHQLTSLFVESKSTNLNYLRSNISEFVLNQNIETKSLNQKRFAFLGQSWTGIINYLYEKNKANPASPKIALVSLTGSPNITGNYAVTNIFDFTSQRSSFKTKPNEEMKFTIDFKKPVVRIDGYTIRTLPVSWGTFQPTTWTISVSLDGDKWELIDEQQNINFEVFPDNTKTFLLLRKSHKARYVTFQHPPIQNDKFGLCISAFELFGVYFENK